MKYYIKLDNDNVIKDVLTYTYSDYQEIDVVSLPDGVTGGWWKWIDNDFLEIPALRPTYLATDLQDGLMSKEDFSKLLTIESDANNYIHPINHSPSIISQDESNRFVTDLEKASWNAKASAAVVTTIANGLMSYEDKIDFNILVGGTNADSLHIHDYVSPEELASVSGFSSVGFTIIPTYTDNLDGTITLGSGTVRLFTTTDFTGPINEYVISTGTLITFTDNVMNYCYVDYNNGTPIFANTTVKSNVNESNKILLFTVYRATDVLTIKSVGKNGLILANKINNFTRSIKNCNIESGLYLGYAIDDINPVRPIINEGYAWIDNERVNLPAINAIEANMQFFYHSAGNWTSSMLTYLNNAQYDDGTNLVALPDNTYISYLIYRSLQSPHLIYLVMDWYYDTIAEALDTSPSWIPKPDFVKENGLLVGRMIVKKNSLGMGYYSTFHDELTYNNGIIYHNDLADISGGAIDDYYHVTSAQATKVATMASNSISGTFTTNDGKTITITNGLVTSIV